jgi:hypothetical protein
VNRAAGARIGSGHFGAGLFGCEHPFDAGPGRIALSLPGAGLGGQLLDACDAARLKYRTDLASPFATSSTHGIGVTRLADLPAEWSRQRRILGLASH